MFRMGLNNCMLSRNDACKSKEMEVLPSLGSVGLNGNREDLR